MSVTESVADAALVASDQVYDQPAKRSALAPRLGNSPYFKPTLGGYPTVAEVSIQGWTVLKSYPDPTGFLATVYQRDAGNGKFDYMVAFRGTRGGNPQDWNNNLSYGWPDWNSPGAQQLMNDLTRQGGTIAQTANTITFTGHSLGGALAQYAAYQYVDMRTVAGNAPAPGSVSLVTFNGLGGAAGLHDNYASLNIGSGIYDPSRLTGVSTAYFYTRNDFVSTLGINNVNDGGTYGDNGIRGRNDYRLNIFGPDQYPYNAVDAHNISSIYTAMQGGQSLFSLANRLPINHLRKV